jgi:hypothetical protein
MDNDPQRDREQEDSMSEAGNETRLWREQQRRWAPWWVYLIAIALVNQLRQQTVGRDATDWVNVVTAIPLAVAVFAVVTMVYRSRMADW